MGLSLEQVDKFVGPEMHLKDISLSFAPGSRNVILGRTLAGKTSLLRVMAGLDRPTRGRLLSDDHDITGRSVRKRSVAMVYQQFVNYPSLTVYDNIASPLKIRGEDSAEIDRRVRDTAAMLRIDNLLDRLPAELSGGQQQRTAIARALIKNADLLLLDEPLVNLDYKLREELRLELQEIFRRREAVVVYTTTEPAEALMLGGDIVVMHEGRVLQTGQTQDVYRTPTTMTVAEVFSDPPINFIFGEVTGGNVCIGADIRIPQAGHYTPVSDGRYRFGVRSNHLFLNRRSEDDVEIPARVTLAEINGSETFVHLDHNDTRLVLQETGVHNFRIGAEITVFAHPDHFYVYGDDGSLAAAPENGTSA